MLTLEEFRDDVRREVECLTGRSLGAPSWPSQARPEQLRPDNCVHWLYLAGRGAGKTRSACERIKERILSGKAKYIALIGASFADVRDIMVEGESGLQAVCGDLMETYNRSLGEIRFKGGARARFFSGEDPDSLRGWQSTDVWGDELCAWKRAQQTFDMAMFGLRLGEPEAIWTTTPRNMPVLRQLMEDPGCKVTRGTTFSNRENLAPAFFDSIVRKYEGTRLGRQELEGAVLEDTPGALWRRSWFDTPGFRQPSCFLKEATGVEKRPFRTVFKAPPEIVKIVIGLDPTVWDPEKRRDPMKEPDACGIIAAGVDAQGNGHVLADLTAIMTHEEWATLSVRLNDRVKGAGIVAEANQGGALIRDAIRTKGGNVPVILVHASMGKRPRAEPVALLYEQGRIRHWGDFPALEDQMCSWDASNPGEKSPNNVDALIWAFHGLGLCNATGLRYSSGVSARK